MTDPDPGGPKIYGSYESGSTALNSYSIKILSRKRDKDKEEENCVSYTERERERGRWGGGRYYKEEICEGD
jgi:hypothetical protein